MKTVLPFSDHGKHITVITGHYGSGKTEFALQYAMYLVTCGLPTAVVDLDIANPYFRSRERQAYLQMHGIQLYSNVYHLDITADLPAIAPEVRTPMENPAVRTIIDAGGDDSGARVLVQFAKYFTPQDSDLLCVINANRPETQSIKGALSHIRRIEAELHLPVTGLISNTHMLHETTAEDIVKGMQLCHEITHILDIPLRYVLCREDLITQVVQLSTDTANYGCTEYIGHTSHADCPSLPFLPFRKLLIRERWQDAPFETFLTTPYNEGGDDL